MRWRHGSAAAGLLALCACWSVAAAGPQSTEASAYDRLDQKRLAESLSAMGMTELLEALTAEEGIEGTITGRVLRAESRIGRATAPGVGLDERNALLDDAAAMLKEVVDETSSQTADEERIAHFRYQMKFIETAYQLRVEPYVQRLRYLHGGPADRKAVLDLTAVAPRYLTGLNETIRRTMEDWRQKLTKLATVVPMLREVQGLLAYKSSWIRFYRATALEESTKQGQDEKSHLLQAVVSEAEKLAEDDDLGLQQQSLLLTGMAYRELHRHDEAARYLGRVSVAQTDPDVRMEALFESARNLIEQGLHEAAQKLPEGADRFQQAEKAIKEFGERGAELLAEQPGGKVRTDVTVCLLKNYLYETQARLHADKPAEARKYSDQAMDALLGFLRDDSHRDPNLQEDFLWMIASGYRDRSDYEKLGSLVLVGLAVRASFEDGGDAEAEKILRTVLAREDKVSQEIRPTALWRLAVILDRAGDNKAAGAVFLELAQKHPSHGRAFDSAVYAFKSFRQATEDNPSFRERLIEALALLTEAKDWPERKQQAAQWYFDLGWQCQKQAEELQAADKSPQRDRMVSEWMSRAIEAYEKVPADHPAHMEARHLALELLAALPDFTAGNRAELLAKYAEMNLRARLKEFAKQAAEAAQKAKELQEKQDLSSWAAQAELREAQILYAMGERGDVWKILKELPEKYPGTPVLVYAAEFHIRKLIEGSQIMPELLNEAILRADVFRIDHPDKAEQIIQLIIQQIRDRVKQLRADPEQAGALKGYQDAYARFAEDMFLRVEKEKTEDRYALTQMYADSLLEKGRMVEAEGGFDGAKEHYEKARGLFQECEASDIRKRQERVEKIEARFEAWFKAIRDAAGDRAAIERLAAEYFRTLGEEYRISADTYPQARALQEALDCLVGAKEDDEQQYLELAVKRLEEGYRSLQRMELAGVPVDAGNVHGLARAYRTLRQYDQAAAQYRRLVLGIDRSRSPGLYWSIQLEACRCALEGFKNDKRAMADLALLITRLRMADAEGRKEETDAPLMGGLYGEFKTIENEAKELAGLAAADKS